MKHAPHLLVFRSVQRYTCLAGRGRGAALIEFVKVHPDLLTGLLIHLRESDRVVNIRFNGDAVD